MSNTLKNINKRDNITQTLRDLFEMMGFREIKVNKFEEYSLYLENRNFFSSQNIITFTGADGRLMALKPDITLSIIKNIPKETLKSMDKLYYVDEIYRLSKDVNEYKVTDQIGIEVIGKEDAFVNLEVLNAAIESLKSINEQFVLDISHLGFVSSLLDALNLSYRIQEDIIKALYSKSKHSIVQILSDSDLDNDKKEYILTLSSLSGNIKDVLPKALEIVISDQMKEAYNELCLIKEALEKTGLVQFVNLDFSVINDLDYYNGLIFKGYINGISDAVLSGGRYDNLMRKIGKENCAIGFAVSLSAIRNYIEKDSKTQYDVLLTYDADCSYPDVLSQMRAWIADGKSVRLEASKSNNFKAKERFHFKKSGLERGEM